MCAVVCVKIKIHNERGGPAYSLSQVHYITGKSQAREHIEKGQGDVLKSSLLVQKVGVVAADDPNWQVEEC